MDIAAVATAIGVQLVRRLAHGEGAGAYEVRLCDGTRAVLKYDADGMLDFAHSARFAEAMRARGYPAPATLERGTIDGRAYEITQLMPGRAIERITTTHAPQLIALNNLQRDVGLPGRAPWLPDMIASLTEGFAGYCQHDALRAYDPVLLRRLQRIANDSCDLDVPARDVVHYDFSPHNILGAGDTITAVVDWQGVTSGDATFDLVTLAYYTYDFSARDALLGAARERADRRALLLYAAHMVLRQVDWSLRHHDGSATQWSRDIGEALLGAVQR
jgi:Phosphotransferase enzyme family